MKLFSFLRPTFTFLLVFNFICAAPAQTSPEFNVTEFRTQQLLDLLVWKYSQTQTAKEFVATFASDRSAAEQKEVQQKLEALPSLPTLSRTEKGFILSLKGLSLNVDATKGLSGRFVINGQIFTVDPQLPLPMQSEILLQKLSQKNTSSLFSILIPKAEAAIPAVVMTGLVIAGTTLTSKIVDRYGNSILDYVDENMCWVYLEKVRRYKLTPELESRAKFCKNYVKLQLELEAKKSARRMKAPNKISAENEVIKNSLLAPSSKYAKFLSLMDLCPHQAQGRNYKGIVKVMQTNDSQKVIKEDWLRIEVKMKGSKPFKIEVIDSLTSQKVATYYLDQQAVFSHFAVPNPKFKRHPKGQVIRSAAALEPAEIKVSATDNLEKSPQLDAQQRLHKNVFAFVGKRLAQCASEKERIEATNLSSKSEQDAKQGAK